LASPTSNYIAYNREIDVLNPEGFKVDIADVIRALPKINRFNGQTNRPYSVASHSLMCEKIAFELFGLSEPHLSLAVMFHDASEAYVGDIVRPIKSSFQGFSALEARIMKKVYYELGFKENELKDVYNKNFVELVEEIDTLAACVEADVLTKVRILPHYKRISESYVDKTKNYKAVASNFLKRYVELTIKLADLKRRKHENRNVA